MTSIDNLSLTYKKKVTKPNQNLSLVQQPIRSAPKNRLRVKLLKEKKSENAYRYRSLIQRESKKKKKWLYSV